VEAARDIPWGSEAPGHYAALTDGSGARRGRADDVPRAHRQAEANGLRDAAVVGAGWFAGGRSRTVLDKELLSVFGIAHPQHPELIDRWFVPGLDASAGAISQAVR
jgi:hypothetical protein